MGDAGKRTLTVVHSGALGDTILIIPLLRAIKSRFAPAVVTLVTKPSFGKLLLSLGEIDAHFDVNAPEHSRWFSPDAGTSLPWARGVDLVISAVSDGHDAWAANASGVCPANQLITFDPRPPGDYADHVTVFHRRQLAVLELPDPPPTRRINNPRGPMVIHPGSGSVKKNWPLDRFIRLGKELKNARGPIEFLLGPVEQELFSPDAIYGIQENFPLRGFSDLTLLADYLKNARGFIGNDSGVTHLAAQLGIPTIGLFGPSNPVQWRPIGPQVRVIESRDGTMAGIAVDDILPLIG